MDAREYLNRIKNKRLITDDDYTRKELIDFAEKYAKQLTLTSVSIILPSDAEITKHVNSLDTPKGCDQYSIDTGFVRGAIYMRELVNSKNPKGN